MKHWTPIVFSLLLAGCHRDAADLSKPPAPVRAVRVETMVPSGDEKYSATILPSRQVTLSFRVSGIVDHLQQVKAPGGMRSLEPGDLVERGSLLARLRAQDYDLQMQQAQAQLDAAEQTASAARAQLAQAQAGAAKAEADFKRAQALFDRQSLTKSDYDAAKAQNDANQAQVRAAEEQLRAARARADQARAAQGTAGLAKQDSVLTAPFSSAVVQRGVELGALAGPSAAAFVLADIDTVKASFGVPDLVAVHLKPGLPLSLTVEALPGRPFRGVISAIGAVADQNTRLFPVELTLKNPGRALRPGMIASLSLGDSAPREPVTAVPLAAVVRANDRNQGFAVMVIAGGKVNRRTVALGITFGDRIQILSGLRVGESIVSSGAALLQDGDRVEVIP